MSPLQDILDSGKISVLATSDEAGFYLGMAEDGRKIFVQGHPEYDRYTLDGEYRRDAAKGMGTAPPVNYYTNNDPNDAPVLSWRSHSFNLYENWLNYYVYQSTPYNLDCTPNVFHSEGKN